MQKLKKIMALALAMVMVVGGSMTAFADEVTSGSSEGTGTSEGHVDKHVIKVVLPTVPQGSTPFKYIVDAERLIQETINDNDKYANAEFPAAATDTGVYFVTGDGADTYLEASGLSYDTYVASEKAFGGDDNLTDDTYYEETSEGVYEETVDTNALEDKTYYTFTAGTNVSDGTYYVLAEGVYTAATGTAKEGTTYYTKVEGSHKTTYENTSSALTVESRSSAEVILTVEVEATEAETDFTLVADKPAADEETDTPELYLALQVTGKDDKVVVAGDKITQTVSIAGKDDNFETVYKNGAYVYAPVDNATGWNTADFNLTGAVSKSIASATATAPKLTVTWSYADPAAVPAVPTFTAGTGLGEIKIVSEGDGQDAIASITSIMMTNDLGTFNGYSADPTGLWGAATKANGVITLDTKFVEFYKANATTDATITYTTVGGETKTVDVEDVVTSL